MKTLEMKVFAVVLLVIAIGFAIWGVSGHTDAYTPAALNFIAAAAWLAKLRRDELCEEDGECR